MSPWEFTKWWVLEPLFQPEWYSSHHQAPRTQWTAAGLDYKASFAADDSETLPAPKLGTHYVVIEPNRDASYVVYPDAPETSIVRHRWVLVRRVKLVVPRPKRTPMLRKCMEAEERALILSLYFRPWTLLHRAATLYVPHMMDLDISISAARSRRKRLRSKQPNPGNADIPRSLSTSWDDYRQHHIVSKHSMRTIRNFLLTQMPEIAETVEDEEGAGGGKEPTAKVFSPWSSVDSIRTCLTREGSNENRRQYKHHASMDRARDFAQSFWGFDEEE